MPIFAALVAVAPATAPAFFSKTRPVPGVRAVALAAAPSGNRVAVALEDGSVRIYDAKTRLVVRNLAKHPQPCYALDFSSDGDYLASGDDSGRVWIENSRTGASVRQYRTHTRGVQKLDFDLTRRYLVSTGKDDACKIYDLEDPKPKEVREVLGKGQNVYGAVFNPTGGRVFVTGLLSTVGAGRAYDAGTGQPVGFLTVPDGLGVFDTEYNLNGTRIATAGKDGTVSLWDAKGYKKLGTFKRHDDWVMDVAFTPSGRYLASSSTDRTVKVWDTVTFKQIAQLDGQTGVGSPLAFTADGATLATVDGDGYLTFHDLAVAQPRPTPPVKKPVRRRRG